MDKFKKPQNRFITLACYSEQTCQIPCDMIPPGIGTHHSVRNSRLLPLALPVCLSVSLFLFTVHRRTFSCVSCGAIFSHDHFFLILFLPLRRSSLTTNSSLQIAAFFFSCNSSKKWPQGPSISQVFFPLLLVMFSASSCRSRKFVLVSVCFFFIFSLQKLSLWPSQFCHQEEKAWERFDTPKPRGRKTRKGGETRFKVKFLRLPIYGRHCFADNTIMCCILWQFFTERRVSGRSRKRAFCNGNLMGNWCVLLTRQ